MSTVDSTLQATLPRKAIFSTKKSANAVIRKAEIIDFPANKTEMTVTNQGKNQLRFLISGECMCDFRRSWVSFKLRTNTFSAVPSVGPTSIIKKLTIRLPSNGNQILEEIDNYASLSAALTMVSSDAPTLDSKWSSGINLLNACNKSSLLPRARRFVNLNSGGFRTYNFQLNWSAILSYSQYFPLHLVHGIEVILDLHTPQEAFHYDVANERWANIFGAVDGLISQAQYNALDAPHKLLVRDGLMAQYGRPNCNQQDLEYQIRECKMNLYVLYMDDSYYQRLITKANSSEGFNLHFDTYLFNRLNNTGSDFSHVELTESFQNLKRTILLALDRNTLYDQDKHGLFTFKNAIKSIKYRIGARSFHQVDNFPGTDADSYVSMLLATNKLDLNDASNTLNHDSWGKYRNINIFGFEKVMEDLHSGEDTTEGKTLRAEITLLRQNLVEIPRTDTANIPIQEAVDPADAELWLFSQHSVLCNISSKGIALTR